MDTLNNAPGLGTRTVCREPPLEALLRTFVCEELHTEVLLSGVLEQNHMYWFAFEPLKRSIRPDTGNVVDVEVVVDVVEVVVEVVLLPLGRVDVVDGATVVDVT